MKFSLHIFDVLHGDSFLIRTPQDKIGIIDCHRNGTFIPVLEYIQKNNLREIDFICLTHPHSDHYWGMLELIDHCIENGIIIRRFLDAGITPKELDARFLKNGADYFAELYERIVQSSRHDFLHLQECRDGTEVLREPNFVIKALAPHSKTIRKIIAEKFKYQERILNQKFNHFSIVLLIETEEHCILLLSDSEITDQKIIAQRNHSLKKRITVFKLSHHGSQHNYYRLLTEEFRNDNKRYAAISTGCDYGTPSLEAIRHLGSLNIPIYSTNCLDFTNVLYDDEPIDGTITELNDAIFTNTEDVPEPQKIIPYHGDITFEFDDDQIKVATETGREPIVS
ncbi:MAG: hypothetical protein CO189_07725 [candidate division Zixibacteria bacterium CG_4_9_14_3_um_filter_46_8]|nr:MAG: hypothetical protein CO189_07725 [candidate division Zixibacteria bacterium CG_4_9_14_3_um_filter_46_8]